jgi:uncharacterized Zn ribbon protein
MMRFDDLNVSDGDTVTIVADCELRGVSIVVPCKNKTNIVAIDGAYAAIENRGGDIKAWHTGFCFGDPDQWVIST